MIIIGLITFLLFSCLAYFVIRYTRSKELPYYLVTNDKDTILTIAIIGDSWVTDNKLDNLLLLYLSQNGLKSKIISSGHSGAKSKQVYQNLFKDNSKEHSSKFIIENKPEYCIVIVGVNDAINHLGSNFYSYHMIQIIKTLLNYKIKPVIVSLPEFGLKETIKSLNYFKKNRNIISAYFNNDILDTIKAYRQALDKRIESERLEDSIIKIDFDKVCEDYNKYYGLYSNPIHLSDKGYEKLALIIADKLTNNINIQ